MRKLQQIVLNRYILRLKLIIEGVCLHAEHILVPRVLILHAITPIQGIALHLLLLLLLVVVEGALARLVHECVWAG